MVSLLGVDLSSPIPDSHRTPGQHPASYLVRPSMVVYHRRMDDLEEREEPLKTYPPGFEPPTDVNVPWYAWVVWPLAIVAAMVIVATVFRGCMSTL